MTINVKSYAKINWTLDVLFKREDGFHELRTIYQTVSLHDTLTLAYKERAITITCDDARVPDDESNLVYKAAVRLRAATGIQAGAHIHIAKRIPVAAGLGGGSSNAAATLLGLEKLWQVHLDDDKRFEMAAGLGSDVPLFLIGGTLLGIGRGEEIYPIEEVACDYLLLVNPGIAVSTAAAYASLSRLTRAASPRKIPLTFFAAKGIRELPLVARNDFEEVVLVTHTEIAEVKERLHHCGARHSLMSGSGATVFAVFDNLETSEQAQQEMRALGYWARTARTINRQHYQATIFEP
ncbi:MAG: 4-(cytidine 5'-diphospho)-2-C-methyl-D-erythritol kinase [Acidobacteria bacterium]|nr:4-(cytidine 5'-diphospho)-2-C-methyl-D-erythritol kinase [Acidobacteriota bacterium]